MAPDRLARFWSYVRKGSPDTCWEWQRCRLKHKDGKRWYGLFNDGEKNRTTHRISYELANGPIPDGAWVLHSCDNAACVNPAHLRLGTPKENTQDMIAKGRSKMFCPDEKRQRGAQHWSQRYPERYQRGDAHSARRMPWTRPRGVGHALAKLTEEDVIAIRAAVASGETQTAVAGRYGLHKTNVSCIVRRVTWAHVDSQMAA